MPAGEALSQLQFSTVEPPQAHSAKDNFQSGDDGDTPLPESGSTMGSAKTRAAWRQKGVMPYSKATQGSTFNPYAE